MTYRDAKTLHKQDEVCVKKTKAVLTIVSVEVFPKHVVVFCDDGNRYEHTEIG